VIAKPDSGTIHGLFEAQVSRTPHAPAVTSGDAVVTYSTLNDRADQLAAQLTALDVAPGERIGVYAERSVEMLVAVLAALKAGGAYVPLDPIYPSAYQAFVIDDASVRVILRQPSLGRDPLHAAGSRRVLPISWTPSHGTQPASRIPRAAAGDLAYVMYTSGSTGAPKGVMVGHANVVQSTRARIEVYREPVGRMLLLPSFAFDGSVASIFWTLTTGGCLVLPEPGAEGDPVGLVRLIASERVSHVLCVASLYAHILEHASAEALASLRVAIVGGETCPARLVLNHRDRAGHARLFNEYGPTECTVWSTVQEVVSEDDPATVPIGQPIPHASIDILDERGQPVDPGAVGEIYIGGPGVALGFMNKPVLTAAHFIDRQGGGGRVYRTGDLGRVRRDGRIEFVGRADQQVKIRGCRVEPEGVETMLAAQRGVRRAVVEPAPNSRGEKRLVAYVERSDPSLTVARLREAVAAKVPEFMVPAEFVFVNAMPLTPGGKVDRRLLRAARDGASLNRPSAVATALETELREAFEEVLGLPAVGLDENFFEMGGHSLLAVKLLVRLEAIAGEKMSPIVLLGAPTVRQLAGRLSGAAGQQDASVLVPLRAHGSRPILFFVHATNGTALSYQPLTRSLDEEQPVYALEAIGLDEDEGQECRVEEMAVRYLRHIRVQQPSGPYFLAGHSFGGLVAFEIARQLEAVGERVAFVGLLDTINPVQLQLLGRTTRQPAAVRMREWLRGCLWTHAQVTRWRFEPDVLYTARSSIATRGRAALSRLWLGGRRWRGRHQSRLLQALEDVRIANLAAHARYVPQPYSGPVTLFVADTPHADHPNPLAGWTGLAERLEVVSTEGNHLDMIKEPYARGLALRLQACLDRAWRSSWTASNTGQADAVESLAFKAGF